MTRPERRGTHRTGPDPQPRFIDGPADLPARGHISIEPRSFSAIVRSQRDTCI